MATSKPDRRNTHVVSTIDEIELVEVPAPQPGQDPEPTVTAQAETEDEETEDGEEQAVIAEVRGKEHRIEYDRYIISTPKMLRKILALQNNQGAENDTAKTIEVADILVYVVARLVVGWDVTDKAGTVLPITTEVIEDNLDVASLMNIVKAVQEKVFPGEESGSSSPKA